MSFSTVVACLSTLLAPGGEAPGGGGLRPVSVQASARACVIGRPVAVTFDVPLPVGSTVLWSSTDKGFSADSSLVVFKSKTRRRDATTIRHSVVFTATKGGHCELGPFPVLLSNQQGVDTLYALGVEVQFQAEAPRIALHGLQPNATVWQALAGAKAGTLAATFLLLSSIGAAVWLLFRKPKRNASAVAQALSAVQVRQQALGQIEALQREVQLGSVAGEQVPDRLYVIVSNCFHELPGAEDTAEGMEQSPKPFAKALETLLGELTLLRFSPARGSAQSGLVERARQLVAGRAILESQEVSSV